MSRRPHHPGPALATLATLAGTALCTLAGVTATGVTSAAPAAISIRPMLHAGLVSAHSAPPTTALCETFAHLACYGPTQLQTAYDLPALYAHGVTGKGQTIAIVDAFGSPTIRHDLATFDAAYHLPAPPALTIIQPAGKVPTYHHTDDELGWAGETTLDVEYAHALAPAAKILLVETPVPENEGTSGFPEIVTAEKYVIDHHLASVISQSFGATEQTFPSKAKLLALRSAYTDAARHHVTVLAGTGDAGATDYTTNGSTLYTKAVTDWPASDPLVTAVGGTALHLDADGHRTAADTVWNDTANAAVVGRAPTMPAAGGGGRSVIFGRPAFQSSVKARVGGARGVPDVSMSAACNGSVLTYQSFGGARPGWYHNCGTSEATPELAAVVALADQLAGHGLGVINARLYALAAAHAPGIVDVTRGSTTVTFRQGGKVHTVTGAKARAGYDLASGVGTVDAALFVPELAGVATR